MSESDNDDEENDFEGPVALMLAIKYGSVKCVRTLIETGADVNVRDRYGRTALMYAAQYGLDQCIEWLLKAGADVNVRDKCERTVLMYAAKYGLDQCVESLLNAGASINDFCLDGKSALDIAIKHGKELCLKRMLELGAESNKRIPKDVAPLMYASVMGNLECIKVLIETGADVNTADSNGYTPLFFAGHKLITGSRETQCVNALINAGADVNTKDKRGNTLLHYMAIAGHVQGAQYLVNVGADVNVRGELDNTVLMAAVGPDANMLEYLKVMLSCADTHNKWAHMAYCTETNKTEIIRCLLRLGARINLTNFFRQNAIDYHLRYFNKIHQDVAKLLFTAGETVSQKYLISPVNHAGKVVGTRRLIDYLQETGSGQEISLVSLCRTTIRRRLVQVSSENLFHIVPQLEAQIPQTLTEYLLFNISLEAEAPKNDKTENKDNGSRKTGNQGESNDNSVENSEGDMLTITTTHTPECFVHQI